MARWTVRGIDPEVITMAREVAKTSGWSLGACVNEAVRCWYEALPEEGEIDEPLDDGLDSLDLCLSKQRRMLADMTVMLEQT